MKRLICVFLVVLLVGSLCACGKQNDTNTLPPTQAPSTSRPTATPASESPGINATPTAPPTQKPTAKPVQTPTPTPVKDERLEISRVEEYHFESLNEDSDYSLLCKAFSSGVAWGCLRSVENSKISYGLFNKNGEVFYLFDTSKLPSGRNNDKYVITPFINGLSAIFPYDGVNPPRSEPGFVIVNQKGEEVYTCYDKDTYMCGQASNGDFLLLQYEAGGFDKPSAYYYYVLNSDLKLINTGIQHEGQFMDATEQRYTYGGYRIFCLSEGIYFLASAGILLNTTEGWSVDFYLICGNDEFVYAKRNHYDDDELYRIPIASILTAKSGDEIASLFVDESCVYSSYDENMRYKNIYFSSFRGGCIRWDYYDSEKEINVMEYIDFDGNTLVSLPTFSNGVAYSHVDDYSGGYAALYLIGADNHGYVTIIDENGVIQYEPIKCPIYNTFSYHGYIIADSNYMIGKDWPDEFTIITPTGEQKQIGDRISGLKGAVFSCSCNELECKFHVAVGDDVMYIYRYPKQSWPVYVSIDGKYTLETVRASFNRNGELVYTAPDGKPAVSKSGSKG